eukprot:10172598-Alexandrium_andersonii.AAC.1
MLLDIALRWMSVSELEAPPESSPGPSPRAHHLTHAAALRSFILPNTACCNSGGRSRQLSTCLGGL